MSRPIYKQSRKLWFSFSLVLRSGTTVFKPDISAWVDPEGAGTSGPGPTPGNTQVAIGFLRNSSTDIPREAIGPLREVCTALCEIG